MINLNTMTRGLWLPLIFCLSSISQAVEFKAHGVLDFRATYVDSLNDGYLAAGQGKFGLGDGGHFSLAQAGADLSLEFESGFSAHAVVNFYPQSSNDNQESVLGITEAFIKYRTLPTQSGYRFQTKAGIFYPEISLENNAFAWASKDTLNSSTLNTWIGEEIRVLGTEFKVTRLGRMAKKPYDLSFSATAFVNNDPAGALLSWHGWTMSSRQTLWTEKRTFPWFPAREPGQDLAGQAGESDPFLELDDKIGFHVRGQWLLRGKGEISLGYYDNKATPYLVEHGQYGWGTRFFHIGTRWRFNKNLTLTAQYLTGDTLMQSPFKQDVVNNDYASGFVSLSYRWQDILDNKKHKTTLRIEDFSVTDNDSTWGDNNNEDGQALTLNHTYRLNKNWFLATEYNVIDSHRPARYYTHQAIDLVEKQLQISARYFF